MFPAQETAGSESRLASMLGNGIETEKGTHRNWQMPCGTNDNDVRTRSEVANCDLNPLFAQNLDDQWFDGFPFTAGQATANQYWCA